MILDGRDGAAIKVEAVKGLLPPYVFGNLPVIEYLPPAPYNDIKINPILYYTIL